VKQDAFPETCIVKVRSLKNGTREIGAVEDGTHQVGIGQPSIIQDRILKDGSLEKATVEVGIAECCLAKPGPIEIRLLKISTIKIGLLPDGFRCDDPAQIGLGEVRLIAGPKILQIGSLENSLSSVAAPKITEGEGGRAEVRFLHAGTGEISTGQDGLRKK
jgi:hypothetical protein